MKTPIVDVARSSIPFMVGAAAAPSPRPAPRPARPMIVVLLIVLLVLTAAACGPAAVGPQGPQACSSVQPCAAGRVCADGSCVAPCTEGSCATGQCNPATGVCVDCLQNVDCGDGRVCNTFTGLCNTPAVDCADDGDCDGGAHCDTAKGACVACVVDEHCGLGAVCDPLAHACVVAQGCGSDDDCDGQVCDPETRTCVECFHPAHCASGQCDTVARLCVAACVDDDATEPNTGAEAVALSSGDEHTGHICPGDVDEFAFDAEGDVEVALVADGGALSLALSSAAGLILDTGAAGVGATGLAAGRYVVVVRGADEGVTADYALRLTVTPPRVCAQLDAEPNDATAQAAPLPVDGSVRAGQICAGDVDHWRLVAAAGDDVTVTLGAGDGDGALALSILSATGAVLARGDAAAPVTANDTAGGALFVRVEAAGGEAGYTLRATTSAAPPVCVQTDAEPNDTPAQAQALSTTTAALGQVCAGDVDHWRFAANPRDDVVVTLSGSGLRLRVQDASGATVATGTGAVSLPDVAAGTYVVEVSGQQPATEAGYALSLAVTPEPEPDPCAEGVFEPDSAASPRPLSTDNVAQSGRICTSAATGGATDVDFFGFTVVGATREVAVSVRFVDADGDLDVRLKDAAGALVKTSAGVTDEELILQDLAPGSYIVEVYGFSGAQNAYTVAAAIVACADDDLEENDRAGTATPVDGRAIAAVRCPGDDDFYAVRLEAGDALDARLSGTGLTVSLLSPMGALLQADVADGAGRRVQASGLAPGRYVLRVTGAGTAQAAYTLSPTVTATPARCVDDGAEPNNGTGDAFVLDASGLADGSYALSTLTMCEGALATDTFLLDVPAARSVRVALAHATTSDLDLSVQEQRGTSGLFRTLGTGLAFTGALDEVGGVMNAGGRLLVRVTEFGTQPVAGLPYTLGLEVGDPPNQACVDDRFDTFTGTVSDADGTNRRTARFSNDDDTDGDADPLTNVAPVPLSAPETLTALRICPDNADFFSLSLTQGQRVVVDVDYVHASGRDVDLRVYGPDGSVTPDDADALPDRLSCSSCAGVDGNERFETTAPTAGTYFVEVYGFSSGENSYDLRVTTP